MKSQRYAVLGSIVVLLIILAGCASTPTSVETLGSGQMTVSMKAENYSFDPNVVQVASTGELTIQLQNVGSSLHNITVKNPTGQIIGSQDIPPGQTITFKINLQQKGTYNFYCNKFGHSELGMSGSILVGE